MHQPVMDWFAEVCQPGEIAGRRILEVGSYDVNGSVRGMIEAMHPWTYTAIDKRDGPNVDRVMDAGELVKSFWRYDVIISTETLEHCAQWANVVYGIKEALAPGGLLFLTARSPGMYRHDYGGDYWRFTVEDFRHIFADMEILDLREDPSDLPGVFLKARKHSLNDIHVATAPEE